MENTPHLAMENTTSSYLDTFPTQESVKNQPILTDQALSDFQLLRILPHVRFTPSRMGDISFDVPPPPPLPDAETDADT